MSRVTRLLVSGTDDQLMHFHAAMCPLLNDIERRGQTVFYTCMKEDRDVAIEHGRNVGVTMQEMDEDRTIGQKWNTVVEGEHPGWQPLRK